METVSGHTTRAVRPVPQLLELGNPEEGRPSALVGGNGSQGLRRRSNHHVVKRLFSLPGRDTDCDFRLFRRQLIVDRPLTSSSGVIRVEMMRSFSESGARFVEAPVHHYYRPSGTSQFFRIPSIARSMRQLMSLWFGMVFRS